MLTTRHSNRHPLLSRRIISRQSRRASSLPGWLASLAAASVLTAALAATTVGLTIIGASPAFADSYLCGPSASYSTCINMGYTDHGFSAHNSTSYWTMYPGHNCTNYAAYAEIAVNGASTPGPYNLGNAADWATNASKDGVGVNSTPGLGSVAQWNANANNHVGLSGHVAYVENVIKNSNGTVMSITVSEDNFPNSYYPNGAFDWQVISAGSPYWPSNFIHFKDLSSFSSIAVVPTSDGHIQVFSGASGTLKENWYDPATGHVGGWSPVGGMAVQGTPALVARTGQQVIDAFIRNSAGQIVETWYNWGTGQWGGWITVNGGTFTSDPSAVATSDGHDQVFATASSGTLAMNWFDPGSGHVGGGSAVGGMAVQGTPALVARTGQQVIDAFIRNSAGQIVETWYNWGTGQWGGWIIISGATFTSSPRAVTSSDGHDQVFAVSNGSVEQNWFDPSTGQTGGWVTT